MLTISENHLKTLVDESVFIIRETAAQFQNPVILFSGGKDSIVLVHLALKAFSPSKIPFALLHIDTGHNFPETIQFRDNLVKKNGVRLIVGSVQESIDSGKVVDETGPRASRNWLQTITLLDTLKEHKIDAAIGGGRRDEEKARAKERFFSHRDIYGHWNPKHQRAELWNLFNGLKKPGEHFRVFPISNWTELDVWLFLKKEKIELPSLYFSHKRKVFDRDGVTFAYTNFMQLQPNEKVYEKTIRFRTIGDATCTGTIDSSASNIDDIILEVAAARITERGNRDDDKRSDSAMEDRKLLGYF